MTVPSRSAHVRLPLFVFAAFPKVPAFGDGVISVQVFDHGIGCNGCLTQRRGSPPITHGCVRCACEMMEERTVFVRSRSVGERARALKTRTCYRIGDIWVAPCERKRTYR